MESEGTLTAEPAEREPAGPVAPAAVSPVTRAVALLPHALLAGVVLVVLRVVSLPVVNPDTYFHLRFGEEFLHGWSPWHPGSVTPYATRAWVPTQWLSEVVMAGVHDAFGLPGIAWLSGLAVLGYALALFAASRRRTTALVAVVITLVALVASGDGISPRPQVLSYLFVVLVSDAWLRTRDDGRPRWWLVALAWLWPLVHGMWLLGLVISAVSAVGVVLDRRELDAVRRRQVLLVPVAMAVASALTPLGPTVYGAVLVVGSRASYFSEWAAPDYHRPQSLALALLLAAVVVVRMRLGATGWYLTLTVLVAGGFAVYSARTVPVAAALLAPVVALSVAELTGHREAATARRDVRYARGLVVVALLALAVVVPQTASRTPDLPAWVDTELAPLPPGTPVLAGDLPSAYLLVLHPNVDVLIHGYGDAFTDAELKAHQDLVDLEPGWQDYLASTGIERAILSPHSPLATALVEQEDWRVVHRSPDYEYLVAP